MKVKIFGSEQELDNVKVEFIKTEFDKFISMWNSHGVAVRARYEILLNRFLIIYINENQTVSGCSIDSLTHVVKGIDVALKTNFINTSDNIFYKNSDNSVSSISRFGFINKVNSNEVNQETIVYDTLLDHEFELSRFEKKIKDSWHSKLFNLN